jgi:long-chain fatty acid transport protein
MTVLGSSGMFTSFKNDYLKAESMYLTSEIGMAYAFNDRVSFAVGLRYLNAQNEIKAGATFIDAGQNEHDLKLRYDTDADGIGRIIGLNIVPVENLNIGLRYESSIKLNFETDLKRNDFPKELELADYQEKNRRDFPAMAGIGAEYRISPKLTSEVDFSWYFQKDADWGKTPNGEDLADLAGDCWCLGGSFGYQI